MELALCLSVLYVFCDMSKVQGFVIHIWKLLHGCPPTTIFQICGMTGLQTQFAMATSLGTPVAGSSVHCYCLGPSPQLSLLQGATLCSKLLLTDFLSNRILPRGCGGIGGAAGLRVLVKYVTCSFFETLKANGPFYNLVHQKCDLFSSSAISDLVLHNRS